MKCKFFSLIASSAVLFTGCSSDRDSTASLYESSSLKPAVAIIPLIDNSNHALGWNLSDEITFTLCSKLDRQNAFNLALPGKIKSQSKKMKGFNNPFGDDLDWVKTIFHEEEFVVFLEMIEHGEVPNSTNKKAPPETLSAQLNLSVRLRIIDVRGNSPKVVLQEILQDSHFIPRQFTSYNFHQTPWNTEEFFLSPVGIAHAQLIKELKGRIEDYILLAKGS
jgi:hypothetical protein